MGREYSIGEVAELLNVTRDTLRFYEKKKLIVPRKAANGYRYYSGEDIQLLLDLIFLRKLQCSILDIQTICGDGKQSLRRCWHGARKGTQVSEYRQGKRGLKGTV